MRPSGSNTLPRIILAAAAVLATGGESAADEPRRAAAGLGGPPCPTVADIEAAVGLPVEAHAVPVDGCMYKLTGRHRGAVITLMYQPATRAPDVFAEIKKDVTTKGANAQPDRLSLGEGGWGYTSKSRQEAAVVSQGRLYHVEIGAAFFQSVRFPDNAALRVIELGMRVAPGGQTASTGGGSGTDQAAHDACTLASNAEVAEVKGEKPGAAAHWSAPAAAYGGSHCDYTGASIRVYPSSAAFESTLKKLELDRAPRLPVSGIGDKAFFMDLRPNTTTGGTGMLAVYAGRRVLHLTLDADWNEPVQATRPRLERFAKLVVPRLH